MKVIFSGSRTKNIFFSLFLGISFFSFLTAPTVYACDPLACLTYGNKQDALILGEVVSTTENSWDLKINFVFPQNKIRSLEKGDQITVNSFAVIVNLTNEEAKEITAGKKYLMSLNKDGDIYTPAWGIHEIIGTTYSDAQLVKNRSGDDAALQIFINSGGTEKNFYFTGNTAFWRPKDGGKDIQIFPEINKTEKATDNLIVNNSSIGIFGSAIAFLMGLIMLPILGLLSLFTLNSVFAWLYVAVVGFLFAIQRVIPKNIRSITTVALSLGIILMWIALFASYHDLPRPYNNAGPDAKGGFPIAAFEYPPAALGSNEPPFDSWGLFYANLLFWIAIGTVIAIIMRRKLNERFTRILFIASIIISTYGLGYILVRFD
jgi:hypothetical protein